MLSLTHTLHVVRGSRQHARFRRRCRQLGEGELRKIAKDHHAQGIKQQKDDYKLLQAYLDGEDCGDLLDRYKPFPPDENHDKPWFYKPDREAEMRTAYAEFERRLGLNG